MPSGSRASACLAQGAKYSVEAVWGHTTVQQLQKCVQNRRSDFNACKCMTSSCRWHQAMAVSPASVKRRTLPYIIHRPMKCSCMTRCHLIATCQRHKVHEICLVLCQALRGRATGISQGVHLRIAASYASPNQSTTQNLSNAS